MCAFLQSANASNATICVWPREIFGSKVYAKEYQCPQSLGRDNMLTEIHLENIIVKEYNRKHYKKVIT